MADITRRNLLSAGAWSVPVVAVAVAAPSASASVSPLPAGSVYQTALYQEYPDSVDWTWNAINTTNAPARLTVSLDHGAFAIAGWLGSSWTRSGDVFVSNDEIAAGSPVGPCMIVLAAPPGTTGTVTATISAPGAQTRSYPFPITIP
ncbi:hypothetical protein SCB71_16895 [Herbiconiux sp. KACC 21604]|uniref:hypothetical protein n=1 Tax=unclassified Herbiconiux TaxID=2618217 RepID=UPI001490D02C|nr:hypothetical protein [Herbiconiux sp. SALV-R1]QJU54773.1 hypothetical protein HL652_14850 [Herbiconiux sp. SALV-R1]WPO85882.1 hypothetical protein SCB71_16895 [Herbiconiux sp. KACC 21604]